MRIFRRGRKFSKLKRPARRAFIRSTVRRVVFNLIKRRKTERRALEAATKDVTVPSPVVILTRAEVRATVRQWLDRLPQGQREAIRLVYLEGFTHEDAAALLGITRHALDERLHEAIARLRRLVADAANNLF